ncbi:enterotoxin, partial [bacterium]|nr:enterotoxin [bacterium]
MTVTNRHTEQSLRLDSMPRIVLTDGRTIELSALAPAKPPHLEHNALAAAFKDDASGLAIRWSAALDDGANAIIQTLELTAARDTKIRELVFVDAVLKGARRVGRVDGSVVVCGDIFLAVEHPLAKNTVGKDSRVRCSLPRGNVLEAGQTWRYSSVVGVVPPGQLRRGFLYYLERRRAHPYRPFLHYNSWYHLNIGRPDNHMTEAECLATIEHFGRELVTRRGAKMDAFVWDDGWDDFNSLWGFHKDFPDGFRKLKAAGAKYGVAQGVWMSPWGGYGGPKKKRLSYGKSQGYETNRNGFSMAGPKYRAAFRDVCLKMMRQNGVDFFKFDGMGGGGGTGAPGELADDVDAVLRLTGELRKEDPDLFISATVGTWASPFWVLYADSIWRQGGDTGFHGAGNGRQRWITYRDMFCYRRIVQWGPLYPLNSLMLHGPCIGERANPAKMSRDEKSVADEFWTFFGSGTNLQELYISPHLLTPKMWDELAAAAKWSRANADVLVDTHWIGGDPGLGDAYGWASWQPRKGIVALRNPSDKPRIYELELARDLELPDRHLTDYVLKSPRPA